MRFIAYPLIILQILEFIYDSEGKLWDVAFFFIWIGFYLVMSRARRLQHDNENFYIIRGSDERVVPFTSIVSIKKSSTKVNGSRYWKLIYLDEFKTENKCRFFSDFNKEFHNSVKAVNPDVVIWTHPHFNH